MKGTLRLFLTLCMAVLSMTLVQAQERTYSGVVKGSDGQPIIGASVEVVGTTVGTSTGLDGDYTIKANQGSKIKYSFLGTKSVTVTAGGSTTINVTLEDDATALDEVVVQAFGTVKKKDLTGSISSIDSKLISVILSSGIKLSQELEIEGNRTTRTSVKFIKIEDTYVGIRKHTDVTYDYSGQISKGDSRNADFYMGYDEIVALEFYDEVAKQIEDGLSLIHI